MMDELQKPETIKFFDSTKEINRQDKEWRNLPSLEVVEAILVQCNLEDNQCEEKSEVLHIFTPNKCYACLLSFKPSNLVLLKTYNTEFDEIIITFTNQNGWALQIEDKVNLA